MRRALGRGLEALLPGTPAAPASMRADVPPTTVPLRDIVANPDQPRRHFEAQALAALAESIRVHGLLQPIVVRRTDSGYEVIAGERRLRAVGSRAEGSDEPGQPPRYEHNPGGRHDQEQTRKEPGARFGREPERGQGRVPAEPAQADCGHGGHRCQARSGHEQGEAPDDPGWSPDGTRIAFASNRATLKGFRLYVMQPDGTNVTRVTL